MRNVLIVGVGVAVFLLLLVAGFIGGVPSASAVLLDWSTSEVQSDKTLASTLPQSVATGLGGLGNLLFAIAGTVLLWAFRGLNAIAGWIQSIIDSNTRSVQIAKAGDVDTSADENTWAKCESLLSDAIFRGDRDLTIILCERMYGKPFLRRQEPLKKGDDAVIAETGVSHG